MKILLKTLTIILTLLLCACESEVSQYENLSFKLRERKNQFQEKKKAYQRLLQMQEKAWVTTAKERFAEVYDFVENKMIELSYESDLKEVLFQFKKTNQYSVTLTLHRNKVLTINSFIVYLLNEKGLILGHTKKIVRNKTEELEASISLIEPLLDPSIPVYFRIETIAPH